MTKAEKLVRIGIVFNPFDYGFRKCTDYRAFSFIRNKETTLFRLERYKDGIFTILFLDWHNEIINLTIYEAEWVYDEMRLRDERAVVLTPKDFIEDRGNTLANKAFNEIRKAHYD